MRLIRQGIRLGLSLVLPSDRWLVRGPLWSRDNAPAFSLTFDDGPHPEHTPRVLDALARWNLKATFFVVGREAARYPHLVQRIVAEGHTLGNHTFTHGEPSRTSADEFLDEVLLTRELLSVWSSDPVQWVRPPKGSLTWPKLRGLWRADQTVVLWNVDPRDYRMTSDVQAERWASQYAPRHRDIVLLHDNRPFAATILTSLGLSGGYDKIRSVPIDAWFAATTPPAPRVETPRVTPAVSPRVSSPRLARP